MAIVLRQTKGSELTFAEVDGNFTSLFYSASLEGTNLQFYTWENQLSQSFDLSVIPGFGGITVQKDGTTIVPVGTGLNFSGTGVTVTANGSVANVDFTGGGDTYTLSAGTKSGGKIPLNLDAAAGADSTVNLVEGTGITLTQVSSTEIQIDSSGGGATYTNAVATPQNFPGNSPFDNIPTGATFTSKTFPEMMDLMLYPELFPTLVNPFNGFSISSPYNATYQEIGLIISAGTLAFSSTFNRGSINPAYGTNGFRSGQANTYIYGGTGLANVSSTSNTNTVVTTVAVTIAQGNNNWTSRVAYDAGQQPLSSTGNNFSSPLVAGQTGDITKSIIGVYPVFATTANISTLTKKALQSMSSLVEVAMVTESGGGGAKQTIDIPQAFGAVTLIQQFNTLSGAYDTIALSSFTLDNTVTRVIQSNTVAYNRYTHNGAVVGGRTLRFT